LAAAELSGINNELLGA